VVSSASCIEASLLPYCIFTLLLLLHFLGDLQSDFALEILCLAAEFGQIVCWVISSAVVEACGAHNLLFGQSIDAVHSIVKNFVSFNGVFKVKVTFRNMFPYDCSKHKLRI
jgi:hypothetical protein